MRDASQFGGHDRPLGWVFDAIFIGIDPQDLAIVAGAAGGNGHFTLVTIDVDVFDEALASGVHHQLAIGTQATENGLRFVGAHR